MNNQIQILMSFEPVDYIFTNSRTVYGSTVIFDLIKSFFLHIIQSLDFFVDSQVLICDLSLRLGPFRLPSLGNPFTQDGISSTQRYISEHSTD